MCIIFVFSIQYYDDSDDFALGRGTCCFKGENGVSFHKNEEEIFSKYSLHRRALQTADVCTTTCLTYLVQKWIVSTTKVTAALTHLPMVVKVRIETGLPHLF